MNIILPELQIRLNTQNIAYFVKDVNGVYRTMNEAGARMLGQTPISIVGRNDFQFFSNSSAALILERDAHILSTGKMREFHSVVKTHSRWKRFVSIKKTLRRHFGNKIGLICLSTEIPEKVCQDQLVLMRQSIDQIAELTSGNFYERSPLQVIYGPAANWQSVSY